MYVRFTVAILAQVCKQWTSLLTFPPRCASGDLTRGLGKKENVSSRVVVRPVAMLHRKKCARRRRSPATKSFATTEIPAFFKRRIRADARQGQSCRRWRKITHKFSRSSIHDTEDTTNIYSVTRSTRLWTS